METYTIFCRDNMSPNGISELYIEGRCKDTIIQWWKERGFNGILPILGIQLLAND